jgi:hypothetical protein
LTQREGLACIRPSSHSPIRSSQEDEFDIQADAKPAKRYSQRFPSIEPCEFLEACQGFLSLTIDTSLFFASQSLKVGGELPSGSLSGRRVL